MPLEPLPPVAAAPLLAPLHAELVALLRALAPDDWERPTVAGRWRVRDVAAHLLDGDLRRISGHRDGHRIVPAEALADERSLVAFLNELNASGVAWATRLSPRLLVELLSITGAWSAAFLAALPPDAPAAWPVGWAGESESPNWFDVAREYTERWHHQMQVRAAVGAPLLLARRWIEPLLETALRVLPHAYRGVEAGEGSTLVIAGHGDAAAFAWTLRREPDGWRLHRGEAEGASLRARIAGDVDALWRTLFNALSGEEARRRLAIAGDAALAEPFFRARSIMV